MTFVNELLLGTFFMLFQDLLLLFSLKHLLGELRLKSLPVIGQLRQLLGSSLLQHLPEVRSRLLIRRLMLPKSIMTERSRVQPAFLQGFLSLRLLLKLGPIVIVQLHALVHGHVVW